MNTKSFYNQWLDSVRKNVPSLENPEDLTASVMERIENLPEKSFVLKIPYWTSVLSGAVACGLFCLLICEYNRPLVNLPEKPIVATTVKSPLPEKKEDILHFLKERQQRVVASHKLRMQLAQKY